MVGNAPFWKIHKYLDDCVDSFHLFWEKKPACSGFFTILVLPLRLGQAKYTVKIAFISVLQCLSFLSSPKKHRKINKKGIKFKCTACLQLWVCFLCIALLNVKSMLAAQMGGIAERGTEMGILSCTDFTACLFFHCCFL